MMVMLHFKLQSTSTFRSDWLSYIIQAVLKYVVRCAGSHFTKVLLYADTVCAWAQYGVFSLRERPQLVHGSGPETVL